MSLFRAHAKMLRDAAILVLVCASVAVAAGKLGWWQAIDHLIFRAVYLPQPPAPNPNIRLIDIDFPKPTTSEQFARFRKRLASVLTDLAGTRHPPGTVVLDVWIDADESAVAALQDAVVTLQNRGVRVIAAVNPLDENGELDAEFMKNRHMEAFYDRLDSIGHTRLGYRSGVLKYDIELVWSDGSTERRTPALPIAATLEPQVALKLPRSLVVPVGDDQSFSGQVHRHTGQGLVPPLPDSARPSHVIIGRFAEDTRNPLGRPGPLLVAWAMSDLLVPAQARVAREPVNHPLATIGMAAVAAFVAVASYFLGFRVSRARTAPAKWPRLLIVLALGAFAAAVAVLLLIGSVMLLGGRVAPMAFPAAVAALATCFAVVQARRWIDDELVRIDLAARREDTRDEYDVFISYAHEPPENKAWVRENLVRPLAALRHSDGKPYRVFFDENDIKIGTQWKRKIDFALLGTRIFIPVYSGLYFTRDYCLEEIEIADQLRVEGRLRVLPLCRGIGWFEALDPKAKQEAERYLRKYQYLDVDATPEFLHELFKALK